MREFPALQLFKNPETKPDEVCIGNVPKDIDLHNIPWETKRTGRIAIMLNGSVSKSYVPLFVKKSELRARGYAATI